MSAACGSSGVMLESARVVGFHVHFRPDVKETPRSALFPKAFAVSDVPFFPLCGSGDCLLDLALRSVFPSLSLGGFSLPSVNASLCL